MLLQVRQLLRTSISKPLSPNEEDMRVNAMTMPRTNTMDAVGHFSHSHGNLLMLWLPENVDYRIAFQGDCVLGFREFSIFRRFDTYCFMQDYSI
jgi:hypothetical protein